MKKGDNRIVYYTCISLTLFLSLSYHKSLDTGIEQRPMIHYAIFLNFIIFISYISVDVVVTYTPLLYKLLYQCEIGVTSL